MKIDFFYSLGLHLSDLTICPMSFREYLKKRYQSCMITGFHVDECDGAHIIPAKICMELNKTQATISGISWQDIMQNPDNGLLLCKNLHWSFDGFQWTFDIFDIQIENAESGAINTASGAINTASGAINTASGANNTESGANNTESGAINTESAEKHTTECENHTASAEKHTTSGENTENIASTSDSNTDSHRNEIENSSNPEIENSKRPKYLLPLIVKDPRLKTTASLYQRDIDGNLIYYQICPESLPYLLIHYHIYLIVNNHQPTKPTRNLSLMIDLYCRALQNFKLNLSEFLFHLKQTRYIESGLSSSPKILTGIWDYSADRDEFLVLYWGQAWKDRKWVSRQEIPEIECAYFEDSQVIPTNKKRKIEKLD